MLKDREPAPQTSREEMESPKKMMALLLLGSESESNDEAVSSDKTLDRYKAEPCASIDTSTTVLVGTHSCPW